MSVAMARQTLIFKVCTLLNTNSKLVYNNRINQMNLLVPCIGLKTDAKALIEGYKIPEKPKRPLSGYFHYLLEMRPLIKKENPSLNNKELVKTIAERWNLLSPEKKVKYENESIKEKEKYDEELLKYNEKLTSEQVEIIHQIDLDKRSEKKRRKAKKERREEGKPKRPANPFGLFIKENLSGNKSILENVSKVKEKWAQLTEMEKEKYKIMFERNKKEYEIKLAAWEEQMIKEGKLHLVSAKNLHKKDALKELNENKKGKKDKIE